MFSQTCGRLRSSDDRLAGEDLREETFPERHEGRGTAQIMTPIATAAGVVDLPGMRLSTKTAHGKHVSGAGRKRLTWIKTWPWA
jgi:hypothetical protein